MPQVRNRRWWALGALLLAVFAVGLDATILSVALPTLAGALHASESDLQWFSSVYMLAMAAAILPVGLLGDRYGRKSLLLGALALFGASSAAAAYAPSAGAFVAARVVLTRSSSRRRSGHVPSGPGPQPPACRGRSGRSWAAGCCRTTGGAGCS